MDIVKRASLSSVVIASAIKEALARCLKEDPDNIDLHVPFSEMGADSLVLLEVLQGISDQYEVQISVLDVYERVTTIARLAQHIYDSGRAHVPASSNGSAFESDSGNVVRGPAAAYEPAALSVADSGEPGALEAIVRHQLELMNRQLALLSGGSAGVVARTKRAGAVTVPKQAAASESARPAEASAASITEVGKDRFSVFSADLRRDVRAGDPDKVAYVDGLARRLNQKTLQSKELTGSYRRALADNRASAGFKPLLKQMTYPLLAERADGAHLIDVDGNRFLDFTMGFGTHLLGHAPDFIHNSISEQLSRGIPIGPQSPLSGDVARLICELTGHARVTFCNSGTEATMTATRVARAHTGRRKVVIFKDSYHGTFDAFLARPAGSELGTKPASLGTVQSMVEDTIVLDYCSRQALEAIEQHGAEIAAVLVEPVQSRAPATRPQEFLRELRKLTREHGIVLIFDEVITGFRCALGGAQEYFDIQADLCTYGKIVGGGMPIGVVAGSADLMDRIDGGAWNYSDDSYPNTPPIFFAGTFSKHPLAMAASLAVLRHLKAAGPELFSRLNAKAEQLCGQLTAVFDSLGVAIDIEQFSSLFRFTSKGSLDLFFLRLLDAGYYIWEGRNCFLSTAHADGDLVGFVDAVRTVVTELAERNLVPKRHTTGTASLAVVPVTSAQKRFVELALSQPEASTACNLCFGLSFESPVSRERLAEAAKGALETHRILSTRFDLRAGTQQRAAGRGLEVCVQRLAVPGSASDLETVDALLRVQQRTPLAPERGENVRVVVYAFDDDTTLLSLCIHHLVCDGWALGLLLERIGALYTGAAAAASPAARVDLWEEQEAGYRASPRYRDDAEFWSRTIDEIVAYQASHQYAAVVHHNQVGARRGGRARITLDEAVTSRLVAQAKARRVTTFTLLLAVFQVFLGRIYSGRRPIIGVPFANRSTGALRAQMGSCVNLLPFASLPQPHVEFEAALVHAKRAMSEVLPRSAYPYSEICELYRSRTGAEKTGPVEVTLNIEPIQRLPLFGAVQPKLIAGPNESIEFDLMFNIFILEEALHVELDYDADLFPEPMVYGWLNLLGKLIEVESSKMRSPDEVIRSNGATAKHGSSIAAG